MQDFIDDLRSVNKADDEKKMTEDQFFAVAVRDGDKLSLFLRIRRNRKGEVFVKLAAGDSEPDWDPHVSYHESGQFHHKSHDRPFSVHTKQKPGPRFRGTEHLGNFVIDAELARALPRCKVQQFSEILEIPIEIIGPRGTDPRTGVSVDLVEPGTSPTEAVPRGRIVDERVFDKAVPQIVVRLWNCHG